MEFKGFSEAELNSFSKDMIISLYLQLSASFQLLSEQSDRIMQQNEAQMKQIEKLQESVAILTNHRFGRKSEKTSEIFPGQLRFTADGSVILNEAEMIADALPEEEKSDEEPFVTSVKSPPQSNAGSGSESMTRMPAKIRPFFIFTLPS